MNIVSVPIFPRDKTADPSARKSGGECIPYPPHCHRKTITRPPAAAWLMARPAPRRGSCQGQVPSKALFRCLTNSPILSPHRHFNAHEPPPPAPGRHEGTQKRVRPEIGIGTVRVVGNSREGKAAIGKAESRNRREEGANAEARKAESRNGTTCRYLDSVERRITLWS